MILGLGCQAEVGKTTAARLLQPFGFEEVTFAEPLKRILWAANPTLSSGESLQDTLRVRGWRETQSLPEVRRMLCGVGDGVRASLGPDVLLDRVRRSVLSGGNWVVSDVRYRREFDMLRGLGAIMVRIVRDGATPVDHRSEYELLGADWDHVVDNNGSLHYLRDRLVRIIEDERQQLQSVRVR